MGSSYFRGSGSKGSAFKAGNTNLTARAGGASAYASRSAGFGAQKNISAAKVMAKYMKPMAKTAATNAPGPKKV